MTVSGFDSYGALPGADLGSHGFIGRYVSGVEGKCVVPAEVTAYHKAGKSLILVYEDEAEDALCGGNMGAVKGQVARPILAAIGWPRGLPVHFAVDFSVLPEQYAAVLACVLAFAVKIDRPAGVYGDVNICTYAHEHGVKYIWQFGEGRAPGVTISQGYPPIIVAGAQVDPDTALADDYGQWAPTPPPTPFQSKWRRWATLHWWKGDPTP